MSGWRLARSLDRLRMKILARHPGTTVWTIGDQAHQSGPSDHNPNPAGVVCAIDVLGDRGLDLADFADRVVRSGHPALKYVIFNRRIWSPGRGWRTYTGSNPHSTHVHVSVGTGPDGRSTGPYDDTTLWNLWPPPKPKPAPAAPAKEDDMPTPAEIWAHGLPDPRHPGKTVPASSLLRYAEVRHQAVLSELAAMEAREGARAAQLAALIREVPAGRPLDADQLDQLAARMEAAATEAGRAAQAEVLARLAAAGDALTGEST